MGVHIDGYPVISAQTFVVNTLKEMIEDKRANVLIAVNVAAKCILNNITPEMKWADVKRIINLVALEFDCFSVGDLQLAELGRFKLYAALDGDRDNKHSPLGEGGTGIGIGMGKGTASGDEDSKASSGGQIWSFNIAMSSCNDTVESEMKPTIYEKVPRYSLQPQDEIVSTSFFRSFQAFPWFSF